MSLFSVGKHTEFRLLYKECHLFWTWQLQCFAVLSIDLGEWLNLWWILRSLWKPGSSGHKALLYFSPLWSSGSKWHFCFFNCIFRPGIFFLQNAIIERAVNFQIRVECEFCNIFPYNIGQIISNLLTLSSSPLQAYFWKNHMCKALNRPAGVQVQESLLLLCLQSCFCLSLPSVLSLIIALFSTHSCSCFLDCFLSFSVT